MRYFFAFLLLVLVCFSGQAEFRVGFSERDVTPTKPIPMWGYGARHALPGEGVKLALKVKTVVIDTGKEKLAVMGLDLGRSPTFASMERIQKAVKEQAGVTFCMLSGSHTHHGPVLELIDVEGYGKGKYDDAVAYVGELEEKIIAAIVEAAAGAVDARIGWASEDTDFNRNRHTKIEPKPKDPELAVVRFDRLDGSPIAVMVNFAAHPVLEDIFDRRWSAEWPGYMQEEMESVLGTKVFFMQGAAGNMSPNTNEHRRGAEGFGRAIAAKALEIHGRIVTSVPAKPSLAGIEDVFPYKSRIDLMNPLIIGTFKQMFFPEITAMLVEMPDNTISPRMITVLVNGELALVGGSGEFFCQHATRLKQSAKSKETFFFGYCNGHCMYFPTLDAIEEGGYGADPSVSWVPPGAGEEMTDKAIANIEKLLLDTQ